MPSNSLICNLWDTSQNSKGLQVPRTLFAMYEKATNEIT